MKKNALWAGLALVGCALVADVNAQESSPNVTKQAVTSQATITVIADDGQAEVATLPEYWLGIGGEEADELLLAQLKLSGAFAVRSVVANSPAAKAGLQKNDLILRFGDREVHNLKDLMDALSTVKGQETEVVLLRAGEQATIKVTPENRPATAGEGAAPPEALRDITVWMDKLGKGEAGAARIIGMRPFAFWGGGAGAAAIPPNTSITIRQEQEGPAKIEVTREGKTWNVTEENLQELPEDVRTAISQMLHGGPMALRMQTLPGLPEQIQNKLELRFEAPEGEAQPRAEGSPSGVEKRQKLRIQAVPGPGKSLGDLEAKLDTLLKKVEGIEQELTRLKEKNP